MHAKKAAKKQVKAEQAAVRAILLEWDPFGDSPGDEFDWLVDHVVSALHQGKTNKTDIARVLGSELREHFGIQETDTTMSPIAEKIVAYWQERRA